MMKKITGIVLCLALLLSASCAFATPEPETTHTYAEPSVDVYLAYHLYETFMWSIPNDDLKMDLYNRTSFGELKAWDVFVGNGTLNMYVASDNGFKLKFMSDKEEYANIALNYDLYTVEEEGTAINKGTPITYEGKSLYKVFDVTTDEKKKEKTMYYEIITVPTLNGSYDDYLTFYALVDQK